MKLSARRTVAVLVALIALMAGVAGTAQAAERATHYFTTFLESAPYDSLPDYCQPAREIYIEDDEDGYAWGQRWSGTEHVLNPEIHLGTDTYIWGDCLYPIDGWYTHVSSLQAKNHPTWPTAYIQADWDFGGADRDVTWGSFLDRL